MRYFYYSTSNMIRKCILDKNIQKYIKICYIYGCIYIYIDNIDIHIYNGKLI